MIERKDAQLTGTDSCAQCKNRSPKGVTLAQRCLLVNISWDDFGILNEGLVHINSMVCPRFKAGEPVAAEPKACS